MASLQRTNGQVQIIAVPSQVVAFIKLSFPQMHPDTPNDSHNLTANQCNVGLLSALMALVDRVPDRLIARLSPDDFTLFTIGTETIRTVVRRLEATDIRTEHGAGGVPLRGSNSIGGWNPVMLVRKALASCPDEAPATSETRLGFVQDQTLRDELESDLSAVETAIANHEWKAATVLGGALIEALLLWGLDRTGVASCVNAPKKPTRILAPVGVH